MVNELMKKVFYLLTRRLGNLGLQLVFANFSKLIVAADKSSLGEVKTSIEYSLKKCVEENQKLFRYVSLSPCEQVYKGLVFRDGFNFVAMLQDGGFYYRLELEHLLNPPVAKYFKLLLIHFVQRLCAIKDELLKEYQ